MARLLRHRQTKGAETDGPILPPPRHIPTLPKCDVRRRHGACPDLRAIFDDLLCRLLGPSGFLSHLRSLMATMIQKSSLIQYPLSVS